MADFAQRLKLAHGHIETQANNVETLALARKRVNVFLVCSHKYAPLISMHFLSSSSRVLCLSSSSSCRDLEEEEEGGKGNKTKTNTR